MRCTSQQSATIEKPFLLFRIITEVRRDAINRSIYLETQSFAILKLDTTLQFKVWICMQGLFLLIKLWCTEK